MIHYMGGLATTEHQTGLTNECSPFFLGRGGNQKSFPLNLGSKVRLIVLLTTLKSSRRVVYGSLSSWEAIAVDRTYLALSPYSHTPYILSLTRRQPTLLSQQKYP
jgi:hypothetical protein